MFWFKDDFFGKQIYIHLLCYYISKLHEITVAFDDKMNTELLLFTNYMVVLSLFIHC